MSGLTSRRKGARGELELAAPIGAELGVSVARKVRQHGSDADIEVGEWCCEVKRHKTAPRRDVVVWWAARQATAVGMRPALFVHADRSPWQVYWPLSVVLGAPMVDGWQDFEIVCATTVSAWASVVREVEAGRQRAEAGAL
ncbi:hypothetical protein [Paraburkholderia sp. J7]|uniref:hypothetical protein n=1 Tax=Paraburkholderia sp. J7 TaxID=2805438 RepID=UPI002AB5EE82|nr:hypothetical protein [Paraburkholderia sp. J7]